MKSSRPADMSSAGDHSDYAMNGHEHASAKKAKVGPDLKSPGSPKQHQVSMQNGGVAPHVVQDGNKKSKGKGFAAER